MHLFIELWSPKAAWGDLNQEERGAFISKVAGAISRFDDEIEAIGWGDTDMEIDASAPQKYFAVWRAKSREAVKGMTELLRELDWYVYFDQSNVVGLAETPDAVIARMIAL